MIALMLIILDIHKYLMIENNKKNVWIYLKNVY